jgi:nucleotide-binding universal stress UspA family protein
MFNKILVCLDGSPLAEQILPFVEAEALAFESQVILLQAYDVSTTISASAVSYASLTPGILEKALAEEAKTTEDYLARVARRLREKGIDVRKVALRGPAGDVILHYSAEDPVDLIALATHGRSGLGRTVFGSVADCVLRGSGLPILVIKPQRVDGPIGGEPHPFKKILVCLDGSILAEQILPYAAEQAQRFGSRVVLFQAFAPLNPEHAGAGGDRADRNENASRGETLVYLENVALPLKEKGLDVLSVALPGPAANLIVDYAHREGVSLITLATHGRSGLGRAIFGSVADHVLRDAALPILLIKPR